MLRLGVRTFHFARQNKNKMLNPNFESSITQIAHSCGPDLTVETARLLQESNYL